MKAELSQVGAAPTPVVVVDDFTGKVDQVVALASALAPFPAVSGSLYPGLRRVITAQDREADALAADCMRAAAPFIAGAFDVGEFDLREVSFSMVTTPPAGLVPQQRAPHFDSIDPDDIALMLYLHVPWPTGTAFYRHRLTRIERVDGRNLGLLPRSGPAETSGVPEGYISGSDNHYEQIGAIEAVADRLIIYPGCLLHSGIIPPGVPLESDPRLGRLTMNFFVRLNRTVPARV